MTTWLGALTLVTGLHLLMTTLMWEHLVTTIKGETAGDSEADQ